MNSQICVSEETKINTHFIIIHSFILLIYQSLPVILYIIAVINYSALIIIMYTLHIIIASLVLQST